MAESEFAKRQLKKHGWTEGSGLGKQEHGRSEPIKVSLKMDKAGVGHDPGKEFTDHWWLRVFNEAAQKIGQKQQENPKSKKEDKLKQKKNAENKNNLYKNFVTSTTLTNGVEEKQKNPNSSSEDSSDSDIDTSVPTLNDIHKFCGGATGHKAARFGIKMGGKLARVAQYDKMFEDKIEKEKLSTPESTTDAHAANHYHDTEEEQPSHRDSESLSDTYIPPKFAGDKRHKQKHKGKNSQDENSDGVSFTDELNGYKERGSDVTPEIVDKKSKIKDKQKYSVESAVIENSESEHAMKSETKTSVKSKKKRGRSIADYNEKHTVCENSFAKIKKSKYKDGGDNCYNELFDQSKSDSKRKKKMTEENISNDELPDQSDATKKKKRTKEDTNNDELLDQVYSDSKKKKKTKVNSCNDVGWLDQSDGDSKKKKSVKGITCNGELLDISESNNKKKKKTKKKTGSDELLDQSDSDSKKKKKRAKDNTINGEFLDQYDSDSKKKKKANDSTCNDELLDQYGSDIKKKKRAKDSTCNDDQSDSDSIKRKTKKRKV